MYARDFNMRIASNPELAAKEYARALYGAGLKDHAIEAGIDAFKAKAGDTPYIPNPTEFVELCRNVVVAGAPSELDAFREACKFAGFLNEAYWTHPAVCVAGRDTGWRTLRNRPEKEAYALFCANYKKALARSAAGEDLGRYVPVAAINHHPTKKSDLDNEHRLKALAAISPYRKGGSNERS